MDVHLNTTIMENEKDISRDKDNSEENIYECAMENTQSSYYSQL